MITIIGNMLKKNKATLALAESCTGGLIANYLTNISGSSKFFLFSAVTYSNHSKINILGVNYKTIQNYGVVHEKTAEEMAIGAKNKAKATYGLSTTGITGPANYENKPLGSICIGVAGPNRSYALKFCFLLNDRIKTKRKFALKALDLLRRELIIQNKNNLCSLNR